MEGEFVDEDIGSKGRGQDKQVGEGYGEQRRMRNMVFQGLRRKRQEGVPYEPQQSAAWHLSPSPYCVREGACPLMDLQSCLLLDHDCCPGRQGYCCTA